MSEQPDRDGLKHQRATQVSLDRARMASVALKPYLVGDRDLEWALINFMVDTLHLARHGKAPLDHDRLNRIVGEAVAIYSEEPLVPISPEDRVNLSQLTDEELEKISKGESPKRVLRTRSS